MVTLNMWIMQMQGAKRLMEKEIKIFQQTYPDIEINMETLEWEVAWNHIISSAKKGVCPDILQLGNTWGATFSYLGILKDITSNAGTIGGQDIFVPATWPTCLYPGTINVTSIPWFIDISVLYYRKDIIEQAGFTELELQTWDSFLEVCTKVNGIEYKGKKMNALGFSGHKETVLVHDLVPWIYGGGGDFLTPDGKQAFFNSEKSLKGLDFYFSLAADGYASLDNLDLNLVEKRNHFAVNGDFVMHFDNPGGIAPLVDKSNPRFVPSIGTNCFASLPPAGPAGRYIFCGGSNLAITRFSKHPEEAWELIKFLCSYDSQNRFSYGVSAFPSLLESFDTSFMRDDPRGKVYKESWRFGIAFPNVPTWGAIELILMDYVADIWHNIRDGKYSSEFLRETLNRAADEINNVLSLG